jgi:hypothetical protein
VHELHRGGHTQLEIAEKVGIGAETVSRWLNAPAFPERRIRSDRRRDQALFLQSRKRGLQPSLTRTHYSAGRVPTLLNMRPQTLSVAQKRYLDALLRFCPGAHKLRQFVLQFRAMLRWRSAKRLTTWILDRIGHRFWIPVHGPVCQNTAPRFGSGEAIDGHAMEQWPH